MFAYLIHHGDALPSAIDSRRPLSDPGREAVERGAHLVAARGVKPGVVWHSGKLRARQTAEAYWRRCNPLAEFSATRGLQPSDPPEWIRDGLAAETHDVMLVGHMPHLGRLLGLLTSGGDRADFPAHGVVALEHAEGRWTERWRLDPEARSPKVEA